MHVAAKVSLYGVPPRLPHEGQQECDAVGEPRRRHTRDAIRSVYDAVDWCPYFLPEFLVSDPWTAQCIACGERVALQLFGCDYSQSASERMACDIEGIGSRQIVYSGFDLLGDLVVGVAKASMNLDTVLALIESGVQIGLDVFPTVGLGSAKRENCNPVSIAFCKERPAYRLR